MASVLTTHDGQPLHKSLAKALRREKLRAVVLIAPLLLFVLFTFVFPIADMLFRSVENRIVQDTLPITTQTLQNWEPNGNELPSEEVYASLANDLMLAQELKIHTRLGSRLNYDQPGIASVFRKSGRAVKKLDGDSHLNGFVGVSDIWSSPESWSALKSHSLWPTAFPAASAAWLNWSRFIKSDEGDEANPAEMTPYGITYSALYYDLKKLDSDQWNALSNPENPTLTTMFNGLADSLPSFATSTYKEQFIDIHEGWGKLDNWQTIHRLSPRVVDSYYWASVDRERTSDGVVHKPKKERLYIKLFICTLVMSLVITVSCILLGYPIAYLLATLPTRTSNLLMILVLLPFWTSLLVRTSAWKVLLQQQGVINNTLVWLGVIGDDGRLALINNITGTIITMTHILLPFMILPLFSVMKTISPSYVRAAKSMGASDWTAFRRVYFPNTIPGIGAGSILVFILSIGYYITPELVGGTSGVFISNRIAYHISSSLNWGLAAALGSILLAAVLILYWAYDRIVGIDNVKLG